MEHTFEAGGHTLCIPNIDDFAKIELATLQGYITLALEKQRQETLTPPSVTQVLDWVIASGMTKIRSRKTRSQIVRAIRFLFGRGLLRRTKVDGYAGGDGYGYWPTLLDVNIQVTPKPEFLREKTEIHS